MASRSVPLLVISFAAFYAPASLRADKIQIVSDPPGATVEIDGKTGTTPFEADFPSDYFHDPHFLVSKHLNHPVVAHVNLPGYAPKDIPITGSALEWVSSSGHKRYAYWIFRAKFFPVKLDLLQDVSSGTLVEQTSKKKADDASSELSSSDVVQRVLRAVVNLHSGGPLGAGFFVSNTGIIATCLHVVGDRKELTVVLTGNEILPATLVYTNKPLDFALLKVSGENHPYLSFSEEFAPKPGDKVLAIGNPTSGFPASVSQGIVSAVGKKQDLGDGIWVQTDAALSPGFSGGPLLNLNGEVIGITVRKAVGPDVTGIGFALSSKDILPVFRSYLDGSSNSFRKLSANPSNDKSTSSARSVEAIAKVTFPSPKGAEIFIDMELRGNVPAVLEVSPGRHHVTLRIKGHADCIRIIKVAAGDETTFLPDPNWVNPNL
jgi:S1-C subfamily serine protease